MRVELAAMELGPLFLHPYLDSIGPNFRGGANFASGGSTIRPQNNKTFTHGGASPFFLDFQLYQFTELKQKPNQSINEGYWFAGMLPRMEDFANALYTIDIGQNDLSLAFSTMTNDQVRDTIPDILAGLSLVVKVKLNPFEYTVTYQTKTAKSLDRHRNGKSLHQADRMSQVQNMQGFVDPFKICCGHATVDHIVYCGHEKLVNGTKIRGTSCSDPSTYISWDGAHYTHRANELIARQVIHGSLSDPQIPLFIGLQPGPLEYSHLVHV
ncbi:GDSL esterase/lipase At5g14450-like [Nymphaea colorata]|nr:GDSL esterase/lipase At5g14450-like [Nymphaea colorata]